MKKIGFLSVLTVILAACTTSGPHFTITGNITGSDSMKVLLQKRESGKVVTLDSAISKKGSFKMKGTIAYPQIVYITVKDKKNGVRRGSFYIENSDITFKSNIDSLYKPRVTGSKTQDESVSLAKSEKALDDSYSIIMQQSQEAGKAGDAAKQAKLETKADSVENEMINLQKSYVKNNPASYVTPSVLSGISYYVDAPELESMLNGLDTSLVKLPQIQALKERVTAMKRVAMGQKAPDFTMNDPEGKPVSLYSKLGPKLLLVDFWASWCGPCRHENPNVVKVYGQWHKKGFDVFGVSLDQSKDNWVKAISDDKLTWTHVSDLTMWNNAAAKLYAVSGIPSNFLLDQNGVIIGHNLRGDDLEKKVSEVLGAKK